MAREPTPEELAAEKRLVILAHVLVLVGWLMAMGIMYAATLITR